MPVTSLAALGAGKTLSAGGVASISATVVSTTSTAAAVTGHANIVAGDVLVLVDLAENGGSVPTQVLPSGFNLIGTLTNAATRRLTLSCKVAAGTEASAAVTGQDGDAGDNKVLVVFHPNVAASTITISDVDGQFTSADPTAQTVTSASGTPPLIVIGTYGSQGLITTRIFTVAGSAAKDGEANVSGSQELWIAWKIYNSAPADVVVDMADFGSNYLQSCYLVVA